MKPKNSRPPPIFKDFGGDFLVCGQGFFFDFIKNFWYNIYIK